ncbi:ribonuclease E activity regulator RraA [Thalassotalea agarivorans]|uniref:4-hydroxy-4-methyl-2-oxoglutarate aldolase n=1 Tax=Thalassotalea agarivorans TaxID=349064 RepID=A0A1I0B1Y6_THASX|nr:ribonuclease E activity regulator RraA [Thalassotalea agarivorans]SET00713.1 regulator of ribonuclease activity A [Thalassotalea agarivorans]
MTFSTPDLYDAFQQTVQVAEAGLIHFGCNKPFCGQVVTVECPNDNSLVAQLLKSPGEGKVLVVQAHGSKQFAFLGDNLALAAIKNGWAGVVINGCVRDVEILENLSLGIMALGCMPRKTDKRGLGELGQPAKFLGITISQGDWLYADINGVLISSTSLI